MTEGVYLGVPMILMPLYGDQLQNSMAAQVRGIAKVVRYPELNEQTLRHAVDEVFNNTRYPDRLLRTFRSRGRTFDREQIVRFKVLFTRAFPPFNSRLA